MPFRAKHLELTISLAARSNDFTQREHNMQWRRQTQQFLVVLGALLGSISNGQMPRVRVSDSLEWITRSSELIVLGHPIKVDPDIVHTGDSRFEEAVTIDVERVLFGSYRTEPLAFRWETDRAGSMKHEVDLDREPNVTYDRPQLFFLRRSDDGIETWTLRSHILIKQSSQGLPTANGGMARTAEEILAAVENEIATMPRAVQPITLEPGPVRFERTRTLAQSGFLYVAPKGSVLLQTAPDEYVIVPAYPHLQQHALNLCKSADIRDRERGAYMLRSYPDNVSTSMLNSLLKDEGTYRWNLSSSTACAVYMVRVAAYDTLRDLGVSPPKPLLEECHHR